MGIPMNNIHAPTVPSGPSSGPQANGSNFEKLLLTELIAEKDRVETELKTLGSVLDSVCVDAKQTNAPMG